MNCPQCGAEAQANAVFCPQCGARIAPPEAALFGPVDQEAPADNGTLWQGRYDLRGMVDRLVLSGLVTIAVLALWIWWQPGATWWLIGLGALALLWAYQCLVYVARHYGHRYRLTPQTFFHDSGILVRSSSPIEIIAIDDISYQQSLLERLVNVGTIRIVSADRSDPQLVLRGIRDVAKAFGVIDQARRAERRRRAVRVDNV